MNYLILIKFTPWLESQSEKQFVFSLDDGRWCSSDAPVSSTINDLNALWTNYPECKLHYTTPLLGWKVQQKLSEDSCLHIFSTNYLIFLWWHWTFVSSSLGSSVGRALAYSVGCPTFKPGPVTFGELANPWKWLTYAQKSRVESSIASIQVVEYKNRVASWVAKFVDHLPIVWEVLGLNLIWTLCVFLFTVTKTILHFVSLELK